MATSGVEEISALSRREHDRIVAARGGDPKEERPDKVGALGEAVSALDGIAAPHALIGGVAVGIRSGVPRATLDTNLAVATTVSRAAVIEALIRAGFTLRGEHPHTVNLRHRSNEPLQIVFDPAFDA